MYDMLIENGISTSIAAAYDIILSGEEMRRLSGPADFIKD